MSAFEHGYALVVGVAGYRDPALPELPLAVLNDAVDFACALWNPEIGGYRADRVRLLLEAQATAEGIVEGLEWLYERCEEDGESTALVFFSGHGLCTCSGSFLAAYDARTDLGLEGLIEGEELTSRLKAIEARRLAVFLDCCYAGGIVDIAAKGTGTIGIPHVTPGLDERTYRKLARGKGRALLAASQPGGKSMVKKGARNSVFSECLMQAFVGAAGREGAETIGMLEVFEFVTSAVLERSLGLQQPLFKAEISENFPLVLRKAAVSPEPARETPVRSEQERTSQSVNQTQNAESITNTFWES